MLALNHVTLATACTFTAYNYYFDKPFFLPFIFFVVAFALLPDIDHPKSEISKFFPVFGKVFKHRGFTHSILGVGVTWFMMQWLLNQEGWWWYFAITCGFIAVFILDKISRNRIKSLDRYSLGVFNKSTLGKFQLFVTMILTVVLFVMMIFGADPFLRKEILTLCIFGYLLHILGDFLTKEGVPLFWPGKQKFGLKLFITGQTFEKIFGFLLLFINAYLIYEFVVKYGVNTEVYWESYNVYLSKILGE